jgi:hypothetical protein
MILKRARCLCFFLLLAGCASPPLPCPLPAAADRVSVVSEGWHSDIAIPVDELSGGLQDIAAHFPGAQTLLFGYGKRSFMTAPPGSLAKYFTGIIPGEAAIEVTGMDTELAAVYPPEDVVTLTLPPGGAKKLSAFISKDLASTPGGTPALITGGGEPPVFVYAANSEYTFLHTCNGWAAQALAAAGVPLSPSRVVTAGRLMGRAQAAAGCKRN